MVQIIENKGGIWHMVIHGLECTFIPMALYIGNNLFPEKPNCENGLRWRVNRKWISYNQIKKLISYGK